MITYEILLLMRPDIAQDKQDEVKERIEKIVAEEQGTITIYDKWGKYLLAYPVEKHTYGVYALCRFTIAHKESVARLMEKLKTVFAVRLNTLVMRHIIVRLPASVPSEYRRPDSLEDAPRRDRVYEGEGQWAGAHNRRPHASHGEAALDRGFDGVALIEE